MAKSRACRRTHPSGPASTRAARSPRRPTWGRYERCESADLPLDLPDTVSRVHALVLAEGDGLYVMDTASTFGVRLEDHAEVPGLRLRGPGGFMLGTETTVQWEPEPG